MSKNTLIFFFIIVILLGIIGLLFGKIGILGSKSAVIHGKTITLEVAKSSEELQKGLSQRDSLAKNAGMLFLFDKPGKYQFWMKDMRFSLDIIYLRDNKVVTLFQNIPYEIDHVPNLNLYTPKQSADKVLELNAGTAKELGLKEGETIEIKL